MSDPPTEKSKDMDDEEDSKKDLISFVHKLDSFASTLSASERLILATIIFNSMDPIERMNWINVTRLLEPDEIEILNKLQNQGAQQ
jgi:hypothetical protein